ncbi:MAG: phosphotransacetylase [Hyphomicrobiaceae bacterium]|nr:phosphotransacetylase [Hyphomicrobiaceae bacterium]
MTIIESFENEIKGLGYRVVLPEGPDARVLRASRELKDRDLCQPILLGSPDDIAETAEQAGVSLDAIDIRCPQTDPVRPEFIARIEDKREKMTTEMAERLVSRPLYFGGMLVADAQADTLVAGVSIPTRRVIEAGMMTLGLADGITTPSSFFLMIVPDFQGQGPRCFIYADCGFNIDPGPEELADIAIASAASAAELLPQPPKVAMLSFSTHGSATHPRIDKVTQALELARRRAPGLVIDGEFQADTALSPDVAKMKLKEESAVAGHANVLIFPDLDSGNIAYKLTQYMAGARAVGPILQGFKAPICDLSRGATVEDIVAAAIINVRRAHRGQA